MLSHPKFGEYREETDTKTHCKCCGHYYPTLKEAEEHYYNTINEPINWTLLNELLIDFLAGKEFEYDFAKIAFKDCNFGIKYEDYFPREDNKIIIPRISDILFGFLATEDVSFSITVNSITFDYTLKKGEFQFVINNEYPLILVSIPYHDVFISSIENIKVVVGSLWKGRTKLCLTTNIYDNEYYSTGGFFYKGITSNNEITKINKFIV